MQTVVVKSERLELQTVVVKSKRLELQTVVVKSKRLELQTEVVKSKRLTSCVVSVIAGWQAFDQSKKIMKKKKKRLFVE